METSIKGEQKCGKLKLKPNILKIGHWFGDILYIYIICYQISHLYFAFCYSFLLLLVLIIISYTKKDKNIKIFHF